MADKPKAPSRQGKKAAQFFVSPTSIARLTAACALVGVDRNEKAEELFNAFADAVGIPSVPVVASKPRGSPAPAKRPKH